jgi:hypothetical protein
MIKKANPSIGLEPVSTVDLVNQGAPLTKNGKSQKPIEFHDTAITIGATGASAYHQQARRRVTMAQICLSCAPDKIYSMESLKRSLESRGN